MLLALVLALSTDPSGIDPLFAGVDRPDTPGCAVDVRRRGEIVARRAYGMANLEQPTPITVDTVFEAGSASKQFTGAVIAILAAQGALSLDDGIRKWLPELPPLYEPVTVAMLLHHTSGIRDWGVLAELTAWPRGSRAYTVADAVALIARQEALNFTPGSEYLYSNSNYLLAARIAERASGRPFEVLSQDLLFTPLGMMQTRWRSDFRTVVLGRAQAYSREGAGWVLDMPFEDVVGPGGLLTTVGDLQRWNAVLDAPSAAQATWVRTLTHPGRLTDGTPLTYGAGLELGSVDGLPAISHAGSTAGYRSWLGRFPGDGLSVALLCNAGTINTEDLGPQVAAAFLPPPTPDVTATPPGGAVGVDVAGLYSNAATDTATRITDADGRVRIGGTLFGADGEGRLIADDGRRAQVLRAPDGAVTGLVVERRGNPPVRLVSVAAWTPGRDSLQAFVGDYRSDGLDVTDRIRFDDDGLAWVDARGAAQPLESVYADAFRAPNSGWILRFRRDDQGRIAGFDATLARARAVRFERE